MVTKEEDNFLRIVYLNYRVGTTALRRYFDKVHSNLPADLSCPTNKAILVSLHKPPRGQRRILYQEQWDILYPPSGVPVVPSELDVTLMVCLLRNLPPIEPQPIPNGFDVLPQPSDLSNGAHIARIKYYKNDLVSHSNDGKLSDSDFRKIWINLEMAIHGLGNQQDVKDAADAKSKCLDYKALKELVSLDNNIQRNRMRLTDHGQRIAKLETTVERMEKGTFKGFKDELILSTILDKEVLDNLISTCVLTLDDREEILSFADQSSRNRKLLEIIMQRPYNTFNMFVEAMKESDQEFHSSLVVNMKAMFSNKVLITQNTPYKEDIAEEETMSVKLIKRFTTIVHEIDFDKTGIVDKLLDKGVICIEDYAKFKPANITQQEKSRGILEIIIRKNVSSATTIFLEVLQQDSCYQEYATKIRETDVTQFDLDLLYSGRTTRETKKKRKKRKTRKRNGMTDLMIDKIEKWGKDDSRYINTRATDHVLTCINKHSCVSVTGPSGIGKTALVRHVALQMETNGYTILPMTDAKEVKDHYKSDRKTVYIVDDMCGNFTANQCRIEEWKKAIDDIKSILCNSRYKLILTCRLQVFQDKGFANLEIFKTCECNLRSENLSLTSDEKENITIEYFKENAVTAIKHLGKYEFLPLLCKLYNVEKTNPQFTLDMFLNDPFAFYKKDLTFMYNDCKEGKYKYCALLLLVIFNNQLGENHLTDKDSKVKTYIEDIVEVCEIDETITCRKLKSQLNILIGTFVTYDEGIYKTIHDKLFDFLAFYFGTQEHIIDILIKHAKSRFIRQRCVVLGGNESIHYSIPIPDDKLQIYIERVFEDILISCEVKTDIAENINLNNVKFRNMLLDFMKQLSKHEITAFIDRANSSFLNTMFIKRMKQINDYVEDDEDWVDEYKYFGIILTDDMLQQYIEPWFRGLIKTDDTEDFMEENRLLESAKFRTSLKSFMKRLSTEDVALCIQRGSANFRKTMFVITERDIKVYGKYYERFGLVICDDLLQQYIIRIFDDFIKSDLLEDEISENRPLMNVTFRCNFRTYLGQLDTEQIASVIQKANNDFIHKMFVVTEEDIQKKAKNQYKCFGIVIPYILLHKYIDRMFDEFTKSEMLWYEIAQNRPLRNVFFSFLFRIYIRQLTEEKTATLIQTATIDFIITMFVMTEEDIKENSIDRCKRFGIVIPDNLLQQYMVRLFDILSELDIIDDDIDVNRPLTNITFRTAFRSYIRHLTTERIASFIQTARDDFIHKMFVMTEEDIKENAENRYECFGIVIPEDLLQQYCQRLCDILTYNFINNDTYENRPLLNIKFRSAFRSYIRQLTTENIASFIQLAKCDFIHKMFAMEEEDITKIGETEYNCFGIVIPYDLLQNYIERILDEFTKSQRLLYDIAENRPLQNVSFSLAFQTYIRKITKEQIASLIQTATHDFINIMFVMTEEDFKENSINQYCFGIVIPDDLLQLYIQTWFNGLTQEDSNIEEIMFTHRALTNPSYYRAVRTHMRQIPTENIPLLIRTASTSFINEMFVMIEDDIKENVINPYERVGIVIPDDMLQQYIARLFDDFTESDWLECDMNKNRPLMNATFRTAFRTYISQLTTQNIASLIQTAESDFFHKMFVMAEEDIKRSAINQYECFGIVIPRDMLQLYFKRVINYFMKIHTLVEIKSINRPMTNASFCTAFHTYKRQPYPIKVD